MAIGSINFGGLASGIDTRALIDAIIAAERRPLQRLEQRRSVLDARKSGLEELRSKLNSFLTTLRDLGAERTFRGRATTVSDETVLRATAGTAAETGLFSVEVLGLAAAAKVSSNTLSASDQGLVSDGTITLRSGSADEITIEVSAASANNSLQEVRDAINDADAGIRASILYDGSDYRLIVRAEETGLEHDLTITDSTNLGLDDPANVATAAADASIQVDGIDITSSSNTVSGAISGVTFDLLKLTEGTPVTLEVDNDVEGATEAVRSLVGSYNEVIQFFNDQFDRDDPGPLASDSFARRLQSTVQSLVAGGVEGIPFGEIRSLSSIGVSLDGRTGELSLDAAELSQLLEERFDDVGNLFLTSGSATDPRIRFLSFPSASLSGDFAVELTQAAEQASLVGQEPIREAGLRRDETLTITVGTDSLDVDLLEDDVIDDVVTRVNDALSANGLAAVATNDAGSLRISTEGYGSDQQITVVSSRYANNGRQTGFPTSAVSDTGEDVAGTIDGVAATGIGRTLSVEDGELAGLSLLVTASNDDIIANGGSFGTVSFSLGLPQPLINELTEVTRFGDGRIDSTTEIIDGQLRQVSDEVLRLEQRLASREALLVRTFAQAEQAIALLQSQQAQLGGFTLL